MTHIFHRWQYITKYARVCGCGEAQEQELVSRWKEWESKFFETEADYKRWVERQKERERSLDEIDAERMRKEKQAEVEANASRHLLKNLLNKTNQTTVNP